tara:strand:- start:876 stop:1145 length:270 start_codon:yes stop_codon:yes gene_type:complete
MVKKSDGEIIANAMLKIAEALENVSNSIDELASKTEPTDMSEVAGSLDSIATSLDRIDTADMSGLDSIASALGGTLDVRLDGDIGVRND